MNHHRWHLLEKLQVYVAIVVGLLASYFLAWPVLRPTGPNNVLVFLATGSAGGLVLLAVWAWLLAALCAMLTPSARPEGAVLATLVGLGGLSLQSDSLGPLLMLHKHDLGALLSPMALELIVMVPLLAGVVLVVLAVRQGLRRVVPGWVRPPVDVLRGPAPVQAKPQPRLDLALAELYRNRAAWPALRKSVLDGLLVAGAAFVITLGVAYLLVPMVLFNPERGQILFGLAVAFFLGGLAGNWLFPTGITAPSWLAPIVLGAFYFIRNAGLPSGELAWTQVQPPAVALALDWLVAGCGGAIGGCWLAERLRDLQYLPKPQPQPMPE